MNFASSMKMISANKPEANSIHACKDTNLHECVK